jgi:hypothetical protein
MTLSNSPDDRELGDVSDDQADVTSPGDPATRGEDAPSSGSFEDSSTDTGTAAGDPLAGVGTPDSEPVYPEGSDKA